MTRCLAALCLLLAGCTTGLDGVSSSAACAAPQTSVSPSTVSPGQEVTVSALYVRDDCNDDGRGPEADPSQDVPVVFVQDGRTTTLATADASGDSARVEVTVEIPADAVPGAATLRVGQREPAAVTVTGR